MNIVVAGTGYVGLVTGVCLATVGHNITCVDVNEEKIALMNQGISPIYEPGLEELMKKHSDQLTFTTNYELAYKNADVIFIGVGTPEQKDGSANLEYVYTAAKHIAINLDKDCVVVIKSTVPIGTNDKIEKYMNEHLKKNIKVSVVSNPEFLSQGTAVHDTLNASRIVIGTNSNEAREILTNVYKDFSQPFVYTDRRSAEMIKYASNDFLALKISYINEIANLCEQIGADIDSVSLGMGLDPRIGERFLKAGIGYGGSCFPKDTKALHWISNYYDKELKTVKAAMEVNENQKIRLIKKLSHYYSDLKGLNIAVLGLAFKPGTDDLREAPSLVNIPIMLNEGAHVKVWDPVAVDNYKKIYPAQLDYCETIEDTLTDTDICLIFTEWDNIRKLKPSIFQKYMKTPIVLDGRNCFDPTDFDNTKIIYDSIGRNTVNGHTA